MKLTGKTILVTGGGTGIGAAIAQYAVNKGGNVVLMGRRENSLKDVANQVGANCAYSAGDAANAVDVQRAIECAVSEFGGLDCVQACAGAVTVGTVADTDDEKWREMIHCNLDTAFVTCREALPSLIERKGSIVIVSSIAGLEGMAWSAGYVTAKHALVGLTRSLAIDFGPQGVRANVVCPGWIRTPMADSEMAAIMERESISLDAAYAHVTCDTPLKRAGNAEEIASLCCYLASDEASFITGAVLAADGGSTVVSVPTLRM